MAEQRGSAAIDGVETLSRRESMYEYYEYNAYVPFPFPEVQRATNALLEVDGPHNRWIFMRAGRNLVQYIEALARVKPYLPKPARDSVNVLLDIWYTIKTKYAKDYRDLPHRRRDKEADTREAQRQVDLEARSKLEAEEDAAINESRLPYSAWPLRATPQTRLIAAARYINNMRYMKIRFENEPMLVALRPEAMQMLGDGHLRDMIAGETFLRAYESQTKWEEEHMGIEERGNLTSAAYQEDSVSEGGSEIDARSDSGSELETVSDGTV